MALINPGDNQSANNQTVIPEIQQQGLTLEVCHLFSEQSEIRPVIERLKEKHFAYSLQLKNDFPGRHPDLGLEHVLYSRNGWADASDLSQVTSKIVLTGGDFYSCLKRLFSANISALKSREQQRVSFYFIAPAIYVCENSGLIDAEWFDYVGKDKSGTLAEILSPDKTSQPDLIFFLNPYLNSSKLGLNTNVILRVDGEFIKEKYLFPANLKWVRQLVGERSPETQVIIDIIYDLEKFIDSYP